MISQLLVHVYIYLQDDFMPHVQISRQSRLLKDESESYSNAGSETPFSCASILRRENTSNIRVNETDILSSTLTFDCNRGHIRCSKFRLPTRKQAYTHTTWNRGHLNYMGRL